MTICPFSHNECKETECAIWVTPEYAARFRAQKYPEKQRKEIHEATMRVIAEGLCSLKLIALQ